MLCQACFHAQLSVAVNPDLMFKHYLYVSGTSKTLKEYFDWFASMVVSRTKKARLSILDIACNDGSQLASFKQFGCNLVGVDPAENLTELAMENGAEVVCEYWNESVAKKLGRIFDVIIAQNVLAHN